MLPLPSAILAHTGRLLGEERQGIGANYETYILTAEQGRFVLKIDGRLAQLATLQHEASVLAALRDQRPFVAEPVARAMEDGRGFFLFTCIEGHDMVAALQQADGSGRRRIVTEFGRVLRRVHSWQPDLPRPADWLSDALARAERNIRAGAIPDPIAADSPYDGRDARALLAELLARCGRVVDDTVFCHGDYCLPNVLVDPGGRAVGAIDWSDGGYADRRWDLATACWTIMYNLHSRDYIQPFYEGYGYAGPPEDLDLFEALYALF